MSTSITVEEQTHQFWKKGTTASAVLTAIMFTIFWNLNDPFWISIIRLSTFIFFALSILGYLKLMNGPLSITLEESEDLLLITYQKKGTVIQEEQFDHKTIKQILPAQPVSNTLDSFLMPDAATFKANFTDSDRELYLFEFSGRPLLFSKDAQKKIQQYFNTLDITKEK